MAFIRISDIGTLKLAAGFEFIDPVSASPSARIYMDWVIRIND
jgi:hypothetical protein